MALTSELDRVREELATAQHDLEASRVIRGELALELANATSDRKLAEERARDRTA
ncbi:hypothetical protein PCC9214_05498 (plasmid) [Planktothrix tepida]|uniref:hypothetical protein n=1 Tax=Planktothrix tepida TaxID=1678309 RepID=UPI0020B3ED3E|nr:hypothetical protein [Planktothrix tepida]CAD5989044.1 hypothetical protein PCC9214_05498 [Planktothrix tepida]